MFKKWYYMDMCLRFMMIYKIFNLLSMDEYLEGMLYLFKQEGNVYVFCDMVLCLVVYLKRMGRDIDVFKVIEEVFDMVQVIIEYIYKM